MRTRLPVSRSVVPFLAVFALAAIPTRSVRAQEVDQDIPFDGEQVVQPCSGELVTLEGHMHLRITTSTGADGDVTVGFHSETQGMTATTSVSFPGEQPRKYVSSDVDDETTHFRADGPTTQTITVSYVFIRTGEDDGLLCCGDDWYLHVTYHLTRLDDGTVTALVNDIRAECK